ncbi:MAG: hypothetical protein H7318_17190 [Oligoflexus sp.]|nr:hypothetical protein [Oligoflexus sp.]
MKVADGLYSASIQNLEYNRSGFITIWALDNLAKISELFESVSFAVKPSAVHWLEENDLASTWESFGGTWTGDLSVVTDGPRSTGIISMIRSSAKRFW